MYLYLCIDRKGGYYNSALFIEHGVAILEDLLITLADGIASMYLELISVDSSFYTMKWTILVSASVPSPPEHFRDYVMRYFSMKCLFLFSIVISILWFLYMPHVNSFFLSTVSGSRISLYSVLPQFSQRTYIWICLIHSHDLWFKQSEVDEAYIFLLMHFILEDTVYFILDNTSI